MTKLTTPTRRLVKMGTVIGLAVVCLALLVGLGLNGTLEAQAGAAESASPRAVTAGRPQIGTMAATAEASVTGTVPINVSGSVSGYGGVLPVSGTADVTTVISLTTDATLPISVTVTGSVPFAMTSFGSVTVDGGNLIPAASVVTGVVTIDEELWLTASGHYTQVIIEGVQLHGDLTIATVVSNTSAVTATGSGPVSGQNALSAEENKNTTPDYLPVVMKDPMPVGFFDDFSSYESGMWIRGDTGYCSFGYSNDHYYIKVNDGWNGSSYQCVVITRAPASQPIGTIGVDVRRTSDEDYDMLYGLWFSATSDALNYRWTVDIRPADVECDEEYRPYLWLTCQEGEDDPCWTSTDPDGMVYKCTDDIETEEDVWNEVAVTGEGDLVTVFINGDDQVSFNDSSLRDQGYFNLYVTSLDNDHDVVGEFDDFYAVPQVLDID